MESERGFLVHFPKSLKLDVRCGDALNLWAGAGTDRLAGREIRLIPSAQSSFRIVPMPRFLVNSALPLRPNRSTKNVSFDSRLLSPFT